MNGYDGITMVSSYLPPGSRTPLLRLADSLSCSWNNFPFQVLVDYNFSAFAGDYILN